MNITALTSLTCDYHYTNITHLWLSLTTLTSLTCDNGWVIPWYCGRTVHAVIAFGVLHASTNTARTVYDAQIHTLKIQFSLHSKLLPVQAGSHAPDETALDEYSLQCHAVHKSVSQSLSRQPALIEDGNRMKLSNCRRTRLTETGIMSGRGTLPVPR